jgi:uncharacterized protein (DUF488 family)
MTSGRIYTIGHGGRTTDELLDLLRKVEVQFVIDVRSAPYSRYQPEFSREPLEGLLAHHGLKYVFMGDDLGGRPKDPDCYTDGKVDYSKCRTKEFFRRGIERIRNAYNQGLRLCLLCSEGKPWQCHRSKLVGAALLDEGIEVLHLLPDGGIRTQDEVIQELTGGQGSLFGDHFVSRKAYQ